MLFLTGHLPTICNLYPYKPRSCTTFGLLWPNVGQYIIVSLVKRKIILGKIYNYLGHHQRQALFVPSKCQWMEKYPQVFSRNDTRLPVSLISLKYLTFPSPSKKKIQIIGILYNNEQSPEPFLETKMISCVLLFYLEKCSPSKGQRELRTIENIWTREGRATTPVCFLKKSFQTKQPFCQGTYDMFYKYASPPI